MHKLTAQFYKLCNFNIKDQKVLTPGGPYHSSAAAGGPVSLTRGLGTAGGRAVLGSVGIRRSLYHIEIWVLCTGSGTETNQSTESYTRHEFPFQKMYTVISIWKIREWVPVYQTKEKLISKFSGQKFYKINCCKLEIFQFNWKSYILFTVNKVLVKGRIYHLEINTSNQNHNRMLVKYFILPATTSLSNKYITSFHRFTVTDLLS